MSMNIVPRYWEDINGVKHIRTVPSAADIVVLECEAAYPPSSAGKTVYVYFDAEAVTKLIPELRQAAIAARKNAMEANRA